MHVLYLLLALTALHSASSAIDNLTGTEIQKCINCLCHARTGCYLRSNCARYSINENYWIKAGKPSITNHSKQTQNYQNCMRNENCILNTVYNYTESFGKLDCNCDGVFDCKDRLAIHLFGKNCHNPNMKSWYITRYNECNKQAGTTLMQMSDFTAECTVEPETQ